MSLDTYAPAGLEPPPDDEPQGRTPPQDLDAERACLGAMLISKAAVADVCEVLRGEDFYRPAHELVFAAIIALDAKGERVDPITVAAELSRTGQLRNIGGAPYLHTLVAAVITASNAAWHARIVREKAILRRLVEAGTRIAQIGYASDGGDVDDLWETARAEVDAVGHERGRIVMLNDEIDDTIDTLDRGDTPAVPTPWDDLNYVIRGWCPGRLYTVGARPGVGKSILLLQAALDLSQTGVVAFHSLEMGRTEVHQRILAQMAGVSLSRMGKRGDDGLSEHDWRRIADARGRVPNHRLVIDDRAELRVTDIRAHARTIARQHNLAGVVVDYLQLMQAPRGDRSSRQEIVSSFSRQLKLLAKELQVPVIVASQLNRQPEQRADKRPTMADLRESGAVEQDSDVVMLIHVDEERAPDEADVLVPKNRQGPKGHAVLIRQGQYARLDARQWTPGPPRQATRDLTEPEHPRDEEPPPWSR